ncbi:Skp1 family, dimerization domain-containing protein [Annulohypoxylon maeteangense]|uniref:Skp1 family, dimerization domain-containing protein n=1 Tax=Annulohypoxylon maeteangense TaxID=1927788 RepID=UPI00200887EA|nr:Skp1 family, dimerization domain-containing protein [Annulohypoxylon maeteangense]KAI0881213.1 Skp1 family, dimerization domain-containing protein [Annulohypoxylon maeteangense]
MIAVNFLDVPDLLKAIARAIAQEIKYMSTEQMREYFGIENDFTPEEEKKIREENGWAHERDADCDSDDGAW